MPKAPQIEIIARGLLVHEGRVLLCQNKKVGYYYLPGGHVEFGEPAAYALQREMLEECGLSVVVGPMLICSEQVFQGPKRTHHEINLVFHMEQLAGKRTPPAVVESIEEQIDFAWIELAELHETDLRPDELKAWLMSGGGVDPAHGPLITTIPSPAPTHTQS
ncbi:MAG: NUDIX hydrolase [Phycisphaerales bacterium JB052]